MSLTILSTSKPKTILKENFKVGEYSQKLFDSTKKNKLKSPKYLHSIDSPIKLDHFKDPGSENRVDGYPLS